MILPRLDSFGVQGQLVLRAPGASHELGYWYHSPFFWRFEQHGEIVLQAGRRGVVAATADVIGRLRLMSKPVFFADAFGALVVPGPAAPVRHEATGRPAVRVALAGSPPGAVVIDDETAIVLSLETANDKIGGQVEVETARFERADAMDAGLFGEETLQTPGYYHGYLEG